MKPALLCLIIASIACATPEERLEELEQDFNERAAEGATFEELGELLDEAAELAHRPASRDTIRAARSDLEELKAVWDEVLVHVAEAEEIAATEGYDLTLPQTQDARDRQIASQDDALTTAISESEAAVVVRRQSIERAINRARARIEDAQNIIAIPDRRAAQREQALPRLAELERHTNQVLAGLRALRDAHTDPWERRWADDRLRQAEEMRWRDLADMRESLHSGNTQRVTRAANWIADDLDNAPPELERLRRELAELRAAVTTEP